MGNDSIWYGSAIDLLQGLHSTSKTQTDTVDFVEEFIESPQKVSYIKRSFMAFCVFCCTYNLC